MRNWNTEKIFKKVKKKFRFEPTYEELKLN